MVKLSNFEDELGWQISKMNYSNGYVCRQGGREGALVDRKVSMSVSVLGYIYIPLIYYTRDRRKHNKAKSRGGGRGKGGLR